MGWMLPLLAGGSLLGGIFGRRPSQTTTGTINQTTRSNPTFGPEFSPLIEPLVGAAMSRLRNRGGLPAGYAEQGVQGINSAYDLARAGLGNRLANSGQSIAGGSNPASVLANTNLETGRAGQIGQFLTGLPNVARGFENEDMANALGVLGLGRGSTSTTTGTNTNTIPGETFGQGLGAGITDLGSILGLMYGMKGQGGGGQGGGSIPPWLMGGP